MSGFQITLNSSDYSLSQQREDAVASTEFLEGIMWFSGWIERFLVACIVSFSYVLAFQLIWTFFPSLDWRNLKTCIIPLLPDPLNHTIQLAITADRDILSYPASYDWRISILLDSVHAKFAPSSRLKSHAGSNIAVHHDYPCTTSFIWVPWMFKFR